MNDEKNLMGRLIALALILGAAYGVHAIARGGISCPFGGGSSCMMEVPAAVPSVEKRGAPVEKLDDDQDAETEIRAKAPVVVPPAKSADE